MRSYLLILCLTLASLTATQAASYHRGDKISEHFKQLDLPPEEIDPNVAPLDTNKDDIVFDNEVLDQAEEEAAAIAAQNEITEEAVQSAATTATPAAAAPAAPAAATTAPAAATESTTPVKAEEETSGLAKYCKCTGNHCDCCRNFNLPFIPVKGPGCARMSYVGNEKMSVSLKYGDLTLITRTVSSKRARPICVGLPGGYSQFCGRVYGLSKASPKDDFKACLGFELRADDEVEAALRVSCFKFGPDGLKVADAEPLPSETVKQEEDDDDDIFGFAAGGDDEDEDEYDEDNDEEEDDDEADDDEDSETDYADDDAEDNEEAPADADYGGFSLAGLLDELDDDDDDESKPSTTPAAAVASITPPAVATRNVDSVQSKDDKGSMATEVAEMAAEAATAAAVESVTPVAAPTADTTAKTKKAKKAKKNKKKKAADTESDFAYELLNGLLDFFN